jgi:hypothetical protein
MSEKNRVETEAMDDKMSSIAFVKHMKLPPPLNWLYSLWMKFSHILGMIMSRIILTLLWIVGFGIYGIVMKIINLFKSKKSPDTYWRDPPTDFENSMKYQF